MMLVEAHQVWSIRRRLCRKRFDFGAAKAKDGMAQQFQPEPVHVAAAADETEHAVDALSLHPLRAERAEAETGHGRIDLLGIGILLVGDDQPDRLERGVVAVADD